MLLTLSNAPGVITSSQTSPWYSISAASLSRPTIKVMMRSASIDAQHFGAGGGAGVDGHCRSSAIMSL